MADADIIADDDRGASKRPRRSCRDQSVAAEESAAVSAAAQPQTRERPPTGRILIVHANNKPYGKGPSCSVFSDETAIGTATVKAKASNRNFDFLAADYERMRDAGVPYSGDPRVNKLLPLPRPTYTEVRTRYIPICLHAHATRTCTRICTHVPLNSRLKTEDPPLQTTH